MPKTNRMGLSPRAPARPEGRPLPAPRPLRTDMPPPTSTTHQSDQTPPEGLTRRSFLRSSAVVVSGLAALAASLSPLRHLNDFPNVEQFLQKYYKELTPEEMAVVLKRIEDEVERQY